MAKKWLLVLALCALLFTAAACTQTAAPTTAPTAAPEGTTAAPAASEDVVLDVVGESKSASFSMDSLKALPAVEGQAGIKSSTGKITPPTAFKGVSLIDLLDQVGGLGENMGVEIEAEDGYIMTFSGDQIANGDFITYDPATGDEIQNAGPLTVIVAYEMNGQPLDEKADGRLRLAIISDKNNQVTDGHWSIKWVRKVTVKSMAEEWSLDAQGAIQDTIDRGSFESCSASGCHGASWTDTKAQEWSGTPLWIVVGRVDDEFKHGSDVEPYNRELADAGYTIELVAADGTSVTLNSADIKENNAILLANKVNGNQLTDKDFPLRLVGSGLDGKQSVGGIVKLILHFNETAAEGQAATPAVAPAGEEALKLTGLVNAEQSWSLDMLKALDVVKLQLEHPKKGMTDYEGVRLNDLLTLAGLKADATSLIFTAADGFTAEVKLADVQACKDCLVAFDDDGSLKLAMPGMDSGVWVKTLTQIEVK
ncbi:sulfite oxidase [Longilinea arvoryzae]|uniref:Sulfite oxidase n=1 Tax=Longilinea arvoryzae TaxID=360412 RepID=A0A0S7BDV0_9CHLR|nr:molybdopterin-dependent oxidoreductase [Longilinea arvoryzae]GAP12964.1 sulfite oxidase [Longilinea arvoryzae]